MKVTSGVGGSMLVGLVSLGLACVVVNAPAAVATTGPTLTITPSTGLYDGEVVTVDGTDFAASESVFMVECTTQVPAAGNCDLASLMTAQSDADGSFTGVQFTVNAGDQTEANRCSAGQDCYLVATTSTTTVDPSQTAVGSMSIAPDVIFDPVTVASATTSAVAKGRKFSIDGRVTSVGGKSGFAVKLYDKLGTKYDRVGRQATFVKQTTIDSTGKFHFTLHGIGVPAHYIVELPETRIRSHLYQLSYSKVLTVR